MFHLTNYCNSSPTPLTRAPREGQDPSNMMSSFVINRAWTGAAIKFPLQGKSHTFDLMDCKSAPV